MLILIPSRLPNQVQNLVSFQKKNCQKNFSKFFQKNVLDYQFNDVFPDLLKQPLVGHDHFAKNLLSKQAAAAAAIKGLHTGNGVHPTDDFDLDFEDVDSKILDDPYAFIDPTLFLVSEAYVAKYGFTSMLVTDGESLLTNHSY